MIGVAITVIVACATLAYFCCVITKIGVDIDAMRYEYLDMLKQEVEQLHSCFGHWKEAVDELDRSIDTTNDLLEVLRNERHD